jgi:hypothetical protein
MKKAVILYDAGLHIVIGSVTFCITDDEDDTLHCNWERDILYNRW